MGYGIMPAVLSLFFALMLTMIIKVYAGRKVIPL